MAILNFNANEIDPSQPFELLPPGEYTVIIESSEMKDTKKGTGEYLELVYRVLDEKHNGRKLWDRLNIINANTTAQEIAQRSLSAICHAVNVLNPKDSEELHDKPFIVKVGIQPANDAYDASNVIKGYKPAQTTTPVPKTAQEPGALPWAKK